MKWQSYEPGRHLSLAEIEPPAAGCPICGSINTRKSRRLLQSDPAIELLACPRCQGLSASQMPMRDVLDELYRSYYAERDGAHIIFQNPERLARHILASVEPVGRPVERFRILDFGGGDGTIGLAAGRLVAERAGAVDVQVIDYGDHTGIAEGAVRLRHWHTVEEADGNCDLVIASGVLEHVPDLASILPALAGKMRPGGFLYGRTAHILPLMKLFNFDMNYPAHVHDLGDEFWGRLPSWLPVPVEIVHSRPSIIESEMRHAFLRTVAAYCMKLPSRIEGLWTRHPFCKLYGGWEAVLRRKPANGSSQEFA